MNNGALGLIEVYGYLGAIQAADSALKAANVSLIGCEKVKGGLVTVKLKGDVGAVKASVEAGELAAKALGVLISSHVIPRADSGIWDMLEPKAKVLNKVEEKEESSSEEDKSKEDDEVLDNADKVEEVVEEKVLEIEETVKEEINQEIDEAIKEETNEKTNEDLEVKTVEELRKIARNLKLGTMTNKQIKFARKDKLLEEINHFYQRRDK